MTGRGLYCLGAVVAAMGCTGGDQASEEIAEDALSAVTGGLTKVDGFGENPGALVMYTYAPAGLPAGAPMVVVLHGCTQSAADIVNAGWNALADEYEFLVVYAEQTTDNNPVRCFNWAGEYGDPANMTRGEGENQSIRSMIAHAADAYKSDPKRIFISGFSAGGAFVSVMLATWPELFAAGAIQSGVPYACANTVQTAYDCQQLNQHPERKKSPEQWGALVREADPGFSGPYPRVSIWHGTNDTFIVHHENLIELAEQWSNVHGVAATPTATEQVAGHEHATYTKNGKVVLETYKIAGMGHATAVGANDPDHGCGPATFAQYFEDKGICSTWHIATFFGLTGAGGGSDPGSTDDSGPPTVDITDPSEGDLVAGTVTVNAEAEDDQSIDGVEFYVDGALQATDRSEPYSFEWPTVAFGEGEHEVMAIARDVAGNVGVDQAMAIVDNDGNGAGGEGFGGCSAAGGTSSALGGAVGLLFALLAATVRTGKRRRFGA